MSKAKWLNGRKRSQELNFNKFMLAGMVARADRISKCMDLAYGQRAKMLKIKIQLNELLKSWPKHLLGYKGIKKSLSKSCTQDQIEGVEPEN